MASTLRPSSPNAPARAAQVVVFPTPPLPDTHAMERGTRGGSPLARTGRRREGRRRLPDAIERGLKRGHVQETSDDGEEEKAGTRGPAARRARAGPTRRAWATMMTAPASVQSRPASQARATPKDDAPGRTSRR